MSNKPKYRNAHLRGTQAAKQGIPLSANPYGWDAPAMAGYWDQGWRAAVRPVVANDGLDLDDPDFAEYVNQD